ncbi:MAG: fibronectin type III domain-containing protein [Actinomycetota bacterium]
MEPMTMERGRGRAKRHRLGRLGLAVVLGAALALPIAAPAAAATVPDPPTGVSATRGNASASVSFSAPVDDGGDPITGYTATCDSSDGGASGSNSGSSPISVSGLTNGKTYTCTVVATNGIGDSAASTPSGSFVPATVPDPPTGVSATRGNASADVSFSAPLDDGGEAITGYTATCSSNDVGAATPVSDSGSSPISVSGLTNGKTYECTVHATNAVGDSSESSASGSFVPATVPDPPDITDVTRGNGSVEVEFDTPSDDGGEAITGYTATCDSTNGGSSGSDSDSGSPITVSGLTNGKTYTCTVHATNAVGDSSESSASGSFVPATVPGTPNVVLVVPGNASVTVTFSAGANGGSAITRFDVSCTSTNAGSSGSGADTAAPFGPIAVTGLSNGKTYTCTATATNAVGPSLSSAASGSFIPATVPGVPTVSSATAGNGQGVVAFSAPGSNGGAVITGYLVRCVSAVLGATSPRTATGSLSPVTVSGLTNGKSYTCTVRATNAIGTGLASSASAAFVPVGPPGIPFGVSVLRKAGGASVAFLAPSSNGGSAITSYGAACTSGNGGNAGSAVGSSSPVLVTGLTNGKTYRCKVRAVNAVGAGTYSALSSTFIPLAVPGAPTGVSASGGNGSATVTFTAPTGDGGTPVTAYSITCTATTTGSAGYASGAASPVVVRGLTNGKNYTCRVRAVNAVGAGPVSGASAGFVPHL